MHRLFVALRPPPPLRAALLEAMGDVDGARWQDDDQLHVTLRFIGPVERPLAEDVATALATINAAPIPLVLGRPGQFDRRGRLDTLWVGAGPAEPLAALHRKIDRALVQLGLPAEGRSYHPHITVARFGRAAGNADAFIRRAAGLTGMSGEVGDFGLFESHLSPDGAFYERVARYPLVAR